MHISDYVGDRRFDARNTIESRQRRGQTVHRVAILFSADPPEFRSHFGMGVEIAVPTFHCTRATRLSLLVRSMTATIIVRW